MKKDAIIFPLLTTTFLGVALVTLLLGCGDKNAPPASAAGAATALALPSNIEVIKSSSSSASADARALLTRPLKAVKAFNSAGTDYTNTAQDFHIYHPALEKLGMPDEILCFINKLAYDTMLNKGAYIAMVDDAKCSSSSSQPSQDSSSGSSSTSTATSLVKTTVISSRTNSNAPHIVQFWFDETDGPGGQGMLIKVQVNITEAPSSTKPYGAFDLIFGMYDNDDSAKWGGGRLRTVAGTAERPVAFTFVEEMEEPSEGYSENIRSTIEMALDSSGVVTQGRAAVEMDSSRDSSDGGYVISYAGDYVSIDKSTSLAAVDLQSPICMGMGEDNLTEIIQGYNLYNSATGALTKINSGFSFTYGTGTSMKRGHLGYYGLWMEGENGQQGTIASGSTITKIDWQNSANNQDLTLFKAAGKLWKNTVNQLLLTNLAGIEFNYSDWTNPVSNGQYVVKYLPTGAQGAGFYKVGTMVWSQSGPPTKTDYTTANYSKIDTTSGNAQWLNMYSEQLRGNVRYINGNNFITYYVKDVVMPGSSDFSNGTLSLHCLRDCLKTSISSSDMSSFNGIYQTNPSAVGDAIAYSIATTDMLLKDAAGTAVGLASGASYSGNYTWGIRSGPMVTTTVKNSLTNLQDFYNTVGTVFYEWEANDQNWGQLVTARDASGTFVSFDAPLKISYQHSTANDRNALSTYNGQTFLLEYGGPGSLWGFPTKVTDTDGDGSNDRWLPLASIKDGTLLGSSNQYVAKAVHGEKVMEAIDSSNCANITLALPATSVPSSSEVIPAPGNATVTRPTEADTSGRVCAPNAETGVISCTGI
ncbi:MAG: hypothetical protein HQK50_14920 [Oligoflexia bacterium]|nr:hypothetical protein [Oligoflexia bacterium]